MEVKTLPRPPKTAHSNTPHMSTSRCGNICVRHGFSNSSVDAAVSGRRCVFQGESKSTLFGLLKVDAVRNHSDYLQQNSNAFYR